MAPQLAFDTARQIGVERDATGGVAPVDRAHERERADLHEILARLARLSETARDVMTSGRCSSIKEPPRLVRPGR